MAASAMVRTPIASGTASYGNTKVTVDASNASQGYVMVKYKGSNNKIKVQITKGVTYTYDLNARDSYEVFPLTEGDGSYSIKVFENISGNQYSQAFSQSINVTLENEFTPFLYPNQYVNFNQSSNAVAVSDQLSAGAADPMGVVTSIYNYVVDNVTYDTDKAEDSERLKLYLPDPDETLDTKKGICFDYAALLVTMLRTQRIPTRLEIGYAGTIYHAWISTYVDDIGWVDGIIQFEKDTWTMMDPTFASTGKGDKATEEYITDKSNYQTIFIY